MFSTVESIAVACVGSSDDLFLADESQDSDTDSVEFTYPYIIIYNT